ncbi:MAG: hypothetical protein WBD45_03010 [Terriglobales bacterium]
MTLQRASACPDTQTFTRGHPTGGGPGGGQGGGPGGSVPYNPGTPGGGGYWSCVTSGGTTACMWNSY